MIRLKKIAIILGSLIVMTEFFGVSVYADQRTVLPELRRIEAIKDISNTDKPLSEIKPLEEIKGNLKFDGSVGRIEAIKDINVYDYTQRQDIDYYNDYGIVEDYNFLTEDRRRLCDFALSCMGQIPYYWGGKATSKGLDGEGNNFGTLVGSDYKGRNKKGLDCSSFVVFCYYTILDKKVGTWTGDITKDGWEISKQELLPGDIALKETPGVRWNHTGIFVGHDDEGNELWVHCSSEAGTVVCSKVNYWKYFYRLDDFRNT